MSKHRRSVSQFNQYFEGCSWRYKLQRIDRVPQRPAAWSHHGTAFHTAAEHVELARWKGDGLLDQGDAQTLFNDAYTEAINKSMREWPDLDDWLRAKGETQDDIEQRYELGMQQAAEYVTHSNNRLERIWETPEGVPAIELHFEVEFAGVPVVGFIDLVVERPDGSLVVRDNKTGTMKSKFQLYAYGSALRRMVPGVRVDAGDWWLAKENRLSRPVKLGMPEQEIEASFVALDEGVKAGEFVPQPGFNCRFCDVSHKCDFFYRKS
ncbi:PD-(D/E)XK nuclease family protein [Kitasatospora xanthocidica]|uniref:PD-(D/E)XK nuclease family protein n=1 Tax=Kitasatospora xanthocidica TaxID=83382 RepID=A0A373A4W5_9ACTN|nr:PD-(D/E)XK nuclease family protein [Kitasatospora xanthocidica]RGD62475.1 PD-(D/E)XK nuclease family protein [Kitasatospora xanthocidica]